MQRLVLVSSLLLIAVGCDSGHQAAQPPPPPYTSVVHGEDLLLIRPLSCDDGNGCIQGVWLGNKIHMLGSKYALADSNAELGDRIGVAASDNIGESIYGITEARSIPGIRTELAVAMRSDRWPPSMGQGPEWRVALGPARGFNPSELKLLVVEE